MNWKVVFLILLLIAAIFITFVYYYGNEILSRARVDIISYLENNLHYNIDFKSVDFWPLNKVIFRDIKITNNEDEEILVSPSLVIYYDFWQLFKRKGTGRIVSSFNYISLNDPILNIKDSHMENNDRELINISKLAILIRNGVINYHDQRNDLKLFKVDGEINFIEDEKIQLEMQTNLKISSKYIPSKLLNSFKINDLKLKLNYDHGHWNGGLKTGLFKLSDVNNLNFDKYHLNIKNIEGNGYAMLNFAGIGSRVSTYSGEIKITDGKSVINYKNFINDEIIKNLNTSIVFDSKKELIKTKDMKFTFADNPFVFNGSLDFGSFENSFIANVSSDKFNLSHTGIDYHVQDNIALNGSASININIRKDRDNPLIDIAFYLPRGDINNEEISHFKTHMRYDFKKLYLDDFDLHLNYDNVLSLQGVYDLREDLYSIKVQSKDLELGIFSNYINNVNNLSGKLKSDLIISGKGLDFDNLNTVGELSVGDFILNHYRFKQVKSELWYTNNKFMFENGNLDTGDGVLNFEGEYDLKNESLDFALGVENFKISALNKYMENSLSELEGKFDFNGSLSSTLDSPVLTGNLSMENGEYQDYNFKDLKADIHYEEKNLSFNNFKVNYGDTNINGNGLLELTTIYPYISASFNMKKIDYILLRRYKKDLPLRGNTDAEITVKGPIHHPEIKGKLNSNDTEFIIDNMKRIKLDDLKLDFSWKEGKDFIIDKLLFSKGKARAGLSGKISEDSLLELDYYLEGFDLDDLINDKRLKAKVNINGKIDGVLSSPHINGSISDSSLEFKGESLKKISGDLIFHEDIIKVLNFKGLSAGKEYNLRGNIYNLFTEANFDLLMSTDDGDIEKFMDIFELNIPVKLDCCRFKGELKLSGIYNKPDILIDLMIFSPEKAESVIDISGSITEEYNIFINGENVALQRLIDISDQNIEIDGGIDFKGEIKGERENYRVDLETNINKLLVNDFTIDKIKGAFAYLADEKLTINQEMIIENNSLDLNGDIYMGAPEKLDLNIQASNFSLELLSYFISEIKNVEGTAAGNVHLGGSSSNPELSGELMIKGNNIDIGLPAKINEIETKLILSGQKINLDDFIADYGGGFVTLSGIIRPFSREKTWDVQLSGKGLPFDYGSFEGGFDPEVKVSGPFYKPLLSGDIITHDFIVSLPIYWPINKEKLFFQPNLNLTLYPGQEVYLRNENIDVTIEDGSLTLLLEDGELNIVGQLRSQQGAFDYYNNKFILENGNLSFRKFNNNIPNLNIRAWTMVDGTRITANIAGLTDNMFTGFTSQPDLPEKEILNLLASRGGLGELVSTEESEFKNVIQKEFMRFLRKTFQIDFVSDIEKGVKDVFQLDRMEIDTYELDWNQKVIVHLGKSITDNLYMQYTSEISPEEQDGELSFRYYLNDTTHIEGSWRGEEDYGISIETSLEF